MPRFTHFPNGIRSYPRDDRTEEKSASFAPVVATDSGKTFLVNGTTTETDIAATLAEVSTALGDSYTFVNDGPDGTGFTIICNATNKLPMGGNVGIGKDLYLVAATAKRGDYIKIAAITESALTWNVVELQGVWTKEA